MTTALSVLRCSTVRGLQITRLTHRTVALLAAFAPLLLAVDSANAQRNAAGYECINLRSGGDQ